MGSKGLRDVLHISLPNSFSKVFERSKIKLPLQKNLLLSLDPVMMVNGETYWVDPLNWTSNPE